MFKDDCVKLASESMLKRCANPKILFWRIKRDLRYKAKHVEDYVRNDGCVCLRFDARLSEYGYTELRAMCSAAGISLETEWENLFLNSYELSLKVL